ncbi:hypothetical protein B0O99DRAFT_267654 [Bisporella sp. PMI_857]|nr:hypothetical protein B0O99DRAFT_267654 [Bisporella sp. PMI_857]
MPAQNNPDMEFPKCYSPVALENLLPPPVISSQSHDMGQTFEDPGSMPSLWDSGVTFDLFGFGSDAADWTLNGPDVDFLSTFQVPPLEQMLGADQVSLTPPHSSHTPIVSVEYSNAMHAAFQQSIGRWTPDSRHYRGEKEQAMSSEGTINLKVDSLGQWDPSVSNESLPARARDKLLAVALTSCEPGNVLTVLSAFPTVEVLERLVNMSLTAQKEQIDGYIHVPTFSKADCRAETLAALVIDGAGRSPSRAVQKFGLGLGEILSYYLHKAAERDHTLTRDLGYLQAFSISLQVGLWSGIKNKMELAGSVVGVLLNMIRAGGRYRRSSYHSIAPSLNDTGEVLNKRWRSWVEQESFKRMVYHNHIHCVQEAFMTSAAGLRLSSSELSLPLPESRELWLAQSAIQWKETYHRLQSNCVHRTLSVIDCVADPTKTRLLPELYDRGFAQLAQVYSISSLVREFKQLQSIFSIKEPSLSRESIMADEGQKKRLAQILYTIRVDHESSNSGQSINLSMVRELASMHSHTFFDQVELFVGREGTEEAQTACQILDAWIKSHSSRQAAWHAGQVLRYMKLIPTSSIHAFHAIACYHASLCLWVYGKFSNSNASTSAIVDIASVAVCPIQLDGEETLVVQRWISLNTGSPTISGRILISETPQIDSQVSLNSTQGVMDVVVKLVRKKFQSPLGVFPFLVENICHLMDTIGRIEQPVKYYQTIT